MDGELRCYASGEQTRLGYYEQITLYLLARGKYFMNRYLGLAVAAVISTGGVTAAIAADMPVKAPSPTTVINSWTGWYVGGDMGWAWSRDSFNHSPIFADPGAAFPVDAAAQTAAASPILKGNGPTGALHGGYNWQINSFVVGVEADGAAMSVGNSVAGIFPFPSSTVATFPAANSFEVDWQATLRGRVGFAANDWLLYGTGGLAVAGIREAQTVGNLITGSATSMFSANSTRLGWVAGGGIEKMFGPNWVLRIEYLHADYGNVGRSTVFATSAGTFVNISCIPGSTPFTAPAGGSATTAGCSINNHVTTDLVRVGVSYKFGDAVVAKY
jgi:outer membrane immunogenic protein